MAIFMIGLTSSTSSSGTFGSAENDSPTASVPLRGLAPDAHYTLSSLDPPSTTELSGQALMEQGLPVTIESRPGEVIFVYRRAKP